LSTLKTALYPDDHVVGPMDAPVSLVEYGDYECPSCRAAYPEVERLREALGPQLRLTFRHFPLTQVHPHALPAAEGAEAAGSQGEFWEMHAVLFRRSEALETSGLVRWASALELDSQRFTRELESHRFVPRIRRDFMGGVRSGVNGTPTFFINGTRHDGDYSFEALLAAVEDASLLPAW
jgi:protein-disulfide isomerase